MFQKNLTKVLLIFLIITVPILIFKIVSDKNFVSTEPKQFINNSQNQRDDTIFENKQISAGINSDSVSNHEIPNISQTKDSIHRNWKTYISKTIGFSFQYPPSLILKDKEYQTIDLSGKTTTVSVNFEDVVSQTSVLVEYHFAPNGRKLFEYAANKEKYKKESEELIIDGSKAIKTITTMLLDGKGNRLNPPFVSIVIDFLDHQKSGEIQFEYTTPLPDDIESSKLKSLLSTFKFNK